jgi:hypothetical protein
MMKGMPLSDAWQKASSSVYPSQNINRRHLSQGQRAIVVAKCLDSKQSANAAARYFTCKMHVENFPRINVRHNLTKGQRAMIAAKMRLFLKNKSTTQVAKEIDVSQSQVAYAAVVLQYRPELADEVMEGKPLNDAYVEGFRFCLFSPRTLTGDT